MNNTLSNQFRWPIYPNNGGDRADFNGVQHELWSNPNGAGTKWVEMWRNKDYPIGAYVVENGLGYQCAGKNNHGPPIWAPMFDPAMAHPYRPNDLVSSYGKIYYARDLVVAHV